MEEEDRSDAAHEDSVASQTAVETLNLLTERLQTIFRGELGLVRDAVVQSVGAVKHLASAVRETQLEMGGLQGSNRCDERENRQTHRGEPGTPGANASASYTAAAASSIDTASATETKTDGAMDPAPTDEAMERYLPHRRLRNLSMRAWRPILRNPRLQHLPRPRGPHLAMVGRMRDGRRLRRSARGKGSRRREGLEGGELPVLDG